jgi:DNA excision repair protein ERCC-4
MAATIFGRALAWLKTLCPIVTCLTRPLTSASAPVSDTVAMRSSPRPPLALRANRSMPGPVHRLDVDHSERSSTLLDAAQRSGRFDVRMVRLAAGDYLIDNDVLIERKAVADFAMSLIDGRLFPQAARLARSHHRSLLLIEGPTPATVPDVHPNALDGALVSLAAMWRLPVLHSLDAEHSLRIPQFLADQAGMPQQQVLRRYDRKPKRLASRRLYVLQGLPGVGPALAHRMLDQFGSVERVVTADAATLAEVRRLGPKKAARIRELVG